MSTTGLSSGTIVRVVAGTAALFGLTACGALAEMAVEQVAEEATGVEFEENDGSFSIEGEDISISLETSEDGGSLNIESSEGTVQVDATEDGTVNVTSEGFENEEDQEVTFTSQAEVPDGFPIPFPDGGAVETGSTFENGDTKLMAMSVRYDLSRFDELVSFYDDYFDGDDEVTRQENDASGQRIVGYILNPSGQLTAVSIIGDSGGTVLFIETTVAA